MKKQRVRIKPTGKKRRATKAAEAVELEGLSSRGLLLKLRNYGLTGAVLGGGGYIAGGQTAGYYGGGGPLPNR
jgi:hypothetical protein